MVAHSLATAADADASTIHTAVTAPESVAADNSTIYTAATPPESVVTGLPDDDDDDNNSNNARFPTGTTTTTTTPQPGRNYQIRSLSTGDIITLSNGAIELAAPHDARCGGRAAHWACEETAGWLGFRNRVSGCYLGRDFHWDLRCAATWHRVWERFRVRERPASAHGGVGAVLLMENWSTLCPVGTRVVDGAGRLAVVDNWGPEEVVWEFVEV